MRISVFSVIFLGIALCTVNSSFAEDGYRLWLKYDLISEQDILITYQSEIQSVNVIGQSYVL